MSRVKQSHKEMLS